MTVRAIAVAMLLAMPALGAAQEAKWRAVVALLVFVKENGQWKVAADAAVPMMATE